MQRTVKRLSAAALSATLLFSLCLSAYGANKLTRQSKGTLTEVPRLTALDTAVWM